MAQHTFADGDYPTATILNTYASHEGGAWTSWTPAVTQSGSVASTNTRSRYARASRLITATFDVTTTAAGTAGNAVTLSLPVTAAAAGSGGGVGFVLDTGTAYYSGFWNIETTTTIVLIGYNVSGRVGAVPSFALANTDVIRGMITYEAAS